MAKDSTHTHPQRSTHAREFRRGVIDSIAFVFAAIPFGLISGLTATQVGLHFAPAYFSQFAIHAGASQLASYQLFGAGASMLVIVLTVAIINLRFVMYSASLAPYWKQQPLWLRLVAAHLITDPSYAYVMQRYQEVDAEDHEPIISYFMGIGVMGIFTWMLATLAGITLGAQVPASWSLDFAITLLFLGLVVPALRDMPNVVAAGVGASMATLCYPLPYNLGLIIAAVTGIAAGYLTDVKQEARGARLEPLSSTDPLPKASHTETESTHG